MLCFFFNDTATTEIYTLSLHDALPIYDFEMIIFDMYKGKFIEIAKKFSEATGNKSLSNEIGRAHV